MTTRHAEDPCRNLMDTETGAAVVALRENVGLGCS